MIVVVGARPNFIKAAPLLPALARAGIDAPVAHTGQHYDPRMSDVFFSDLAIPEPAWLLGVGSGTHAVQTGAAMVRLEELFESERPDAVVVVGDVNSTLAGALAAAKLQIPVVHLEAGLRSRDMSMPEEINRLVTDQLSAILLAPTQAAVDNLLAEGVPADRIRFVGNIMAETLLAAVPRLAAMDPAREFGLRAGGYVLTTIHRPENADHPERLAHIVAALSEAPLPVLMPVHPRTRPALAAVGAGPATPNVRLVEPVGYLEMLALERDAAAIVSDSGGVQTEACVLHTPLVTVRRNTEFVETIEVGANRLAEAERSAILHALGAALGSARSWELPERWDDKVTVRIVEALSLPVRPLPGCEA
jgi:UDP-N-acetylglucosamine 2-epimerase (non-hydrolysing)